VKWVYSPELRAFTFQRALQLGVAYPYDWGFVPSTRAEDGDPLDAMLLFDAPSWPGVIIPAKPIGIVRLMQREAKGEKAGRKQRNDRVILRPAADRRYRNVHDLPKRVRQELEQFFVTATELTRKKITIEGWEGPAAAVAAIERAAKHYVLPKGDVGRSS
jgi:inorganic pyrophosphatase